MSTAPQPSREPRRVPALDARVVQRLVVGTVGLTVVFLVLGWMLGTHFVAAETAVIDQVAGIRSGPLTVLAKALTMVGSLLVLGPVAAGVAGWCAYRRRGGAELGVVSAAVGAVVVVDVVKAVVDRPRPMTQHVVQVASASFPSQHAAQAAAILPALALVLTTAHTWMRAWALVVAGVLIVGIGVSRVYLGVHYPSDVVAGWVLGLVWTAWVRHAAPPVHPRAHPLG